MGIASSSNRFISAVLVVGLVVLSAMLWRQRAALSRMEKENKLLLEKGQALQHGRVPANALSEPAESGQAENSAVAPAPTEPAPSAQASQSVARPEPSEDLVPTPTGLAPAPRSSGLALAGTRVAPIEGGLRATMQFNPTTSEPLGIVAVVVRLPRNSESRIIGLEPADSAKYSDVSKRIAEDGKFAIFQGTLESVSSIELALSVSGEVTADVRGTCGIGPFDLSVGPSGTSVSPK
jgi:hypothetical protein